MLIKFKIKQTMDEFEVSEVDGIPAPPNFIVVNTSRAQGPWIELELSLNESEWPGGFPGDPEEPPLEPPME